MSRARHCHSFSRSYVGATQQGRPYLNIEHYGPYGGFYDTPFVLDEGDVVKLYNAVGKLYNEIIIKRARNDS